MSGEPLACFLLFISPNVSFFAFFPHAHVGFIICCPFFAPPSMSSYEFSHFRPKILVAEPECLEIMLLDPANSEWAKGIRHIIFDEVHSVGMVGGEIWERMLLYTSAPFIGLSATLGDIGRFRDWLSDVEKKRGRELHFVHHNERYNDLAPFIWTNRFVLLLRSQLNLCCTERSLRTRSSCCILYGRSTGC